MEQLAEGEEKAGDVVLVAFSATRVKHVKQVVVQREADGPAAFGTDFVRQRQALRRHGKDGDFLTSSLSDLEEETF